MTTTTTQTNNTLPEKKKIEPKKAPWGKFLLAIGACAESVHLIYNVVSDNAYIGISNFLSTNKAIASWIIDNPFTATIGTMTAIATLKLVYFVMENRGKNRISASNVEEYANKAIYYGKFFLVPASISTITNIRSAIEDHASDMETWINATNPSNMETWINATSNMETWINATQPLLITGAALTAAITLKLVIKYVIKGGQNLRELMMAGKDKATKNDNDSKKPNEANTQ